MDETCIRVTSAVFCTILGCSLLIIVDKLAEARMPLAHLVGRIRQMKSWISD